MFLTKHFIFQMLAPGIEMEFVNVKSTMALLYDRFIQNAGGWL